MILRLIFNIIFNISISMSNKHIKQNSCLFPPKPVHPIVFEKYWLELDRLGVLLVYKETFPVVYPVQYLVGPCFHGDLFRDTDSNSHSPFLVVL